MELKLISHTPCRVTILPGTVFGIRGGCGRLWLPLRTSVQLRLLVTREIRAEQMKSENNVIHENSLAYEKPARPAGTDKYQQTP